MEKENVCECEKEAVCECEEVSACEIEDIAEETPACECECACEEEEVCDLEKAWRLLTASKARNFVAVQIAPAVRLSIGEKFGLARGEDGVGKVVAALKMLGADVVVDTAIAADVVTLMKLKKVLANKEAGQGTVFSSECTAWTDYAKEKYPKIELFPSATSVCAKLLKKYYAEAEEGKTVRVIALEMGEAKKSEPGVDLVLTLDELGILLNSLETNVRLLKKKPLTTPIGIGSGAAYIAAVSGGDAEALARCLTAEKNQLNYRKFEYSGLYGKNSPRKVTMVLDGEEWKFAVADSLEGADEIIAEIEAGAEYDYVEITACKGGQIGKGCDLETEEGEMTKRLRHLGLKYVDRAREARSAETSAAAERMLKQWNSLVRSGEAEKLNVIEKIEEDFDEPIEIVEEPVVEEVPVEEEVIEEVPVEEEVIEEVAAEEEVIEEAPVEEEVVEEVIEEPVMEEIVEEISEEELLEEQIEEALEVFEDAIQEDLAEAEGAEFVEIVEEVAVAEDSDEVVEEVVAVEKIVDVEPVVEETPVVEEIAEEPVVEEAPVVEEIAEEPVVEEAPVVEEIAEEPVIEEAPVVEEIAEEVAVAEESEESEEEEKIDYSKMDRRKLKRLKKKNKKK